MASLDPTFLAFENLSMESNGHRIARLLMLLQADTFSYTNLKVRYLQNGRGPGPQDFKTIVWPKLKERWVRDSNGRVFHLNFCSGFLQAQLVSELPAGLPGSVLTQTGAQVASDTIRKQKTLMEADPGH